MPESKQYRIATYSIEGQDLRKTPSKWTMDQDKIRNILQLGFSQINYTLTNYAEHVESISHDLVRLYLKNTRLTAKGVWH